MPSPITLSSLSHALESLNPELLVEYYADDAIFEDVVGDQIVQGKAALLQMYQSLFSLPATSFTVTGGFVSEAGAALQWTWETNHPETGQHHMVRGASIIKFNGNKIIRETIYYDSGKAPI